MTLDRARLAHVSYRDALTPELARAHAQLERLERAVTLARLERGVLLDLLSLGCLVITCIRAAEIGERLVLAFAGLAVFYTSARIIHEAALRDRWRRRARVDRLLSLGGQ